MIILSSFYWNEESQNALLKVLEETPNNTQIYLLGYSKKFFLPTILSRLQTVELKNLNRFLPLAQEILNLEPNLRMSDKKLKKIMDLKVEEETKSGIGEKKDRESAIILLDAFLLIILKNKEKLNLDKKFFEKLIVISTYYDTEGGSPHLFLEWLMLATPIIQD